MITLLTLYQCDKFIIHRAKNTLLYVQCVQSRSKPSVRGRVQTWVVVLSHCQNGQLSHFYHKFINNYSMVLKLSEMIIIVITNGLRSSAMNNIVKWPSYVEKCNIWLQFSIVQPISYLSRFLLHNNVL